MTTDPRGTEPQSMLAGLAASAAGIAGHEDATPAWAN